MTGPDSITTWPRDELERIGDAGELQLASRRPDGGLRPYVKMWVVRALMLRTGWVVVRGDDGFAVVGLVRPILRRG